MTVRMTRPSRFSLVNEIAPATPDRAREHFLGRLAFETDASDLHADLEKGRDDVVVIDVRLPQAYAAEHIAGAISLPHRQMNEETTRELPRDRTIVTYCWSPGCNGSTKGAARLSQLGFAVKELIGGIEYWKREGYPTQGSTSGSVARPAAPPLPDGLPVPKDDGAAAHLEGQRVLSVRLRSTLGIDIDIARLAAEGLVLFVYPKMGRPGDMDPAGWDAIPGARGCTQQTCAFRDLHDAFRARGFAVAGVSAQSIAEQNEAARRLGVTFPLLADPDRVLAKAMGFPTFDAFGQTLYKRLALVASGGRIAKVFYPVFPPQDNAGEVLAWLARSDHD